MTSTMNNDTEQERQIERVRALLAKAESTLSEAEAELLTAKANELIMRHALDMSRSSDQRPIVTRAWRFTGTRAIGHRRLVTTVARSLPGAYALYWSQRSLQTVQVWAEDEATLDLIRSLLVQADTGLALWWTTQPKGTEYGYPATRKNEWLWGFGTGAASRFEAQVEASGASNALVLANASRRVEEAVLSRMKVKSGRSARLTTTGFSEGVVAGRDADTGGRQLTR